MDPQKLSQLDPKLRSAYERVMGTTIPQPTPAQAQTTPPQSQPQPAASIPKPMSQPATNPQPQSSNFVHMNSQIPTSTAAPITSNPNFAIPTIPTQTTAMKKKSGMMPILFVILGVIFIAVYTLFWTKIFNLKLPFLP